MTADITSTSTRKVDDLVRALGVTPVKGRVGALRCVAAFGDPSRDDTVGTANIVA